MPLLVLRITERCNLNCVYCYAAEKEAEDMDLECAIRAMEIFNKNFPGFSLQITGGEPFLNFDVLRLAVEHAEKIGVKKPIYVQTNGTLITKENLLFCKEHNIEIGVSIDGVGQVNDESRPYHSGKGSFNKIVENLQLMKQLNMQTQFNAVLTKNNVNGLDKLFDLAYYLGHRGIAIDVLRCIGRGSKELIPDTKEILQLLKRIEEKQLLFLKEGIAVEYKEFTKMFYMQKNKDLKKGVYCYAESGKSICVKPNGDYYPCSSSAGNTKYRLGNIYEDTSFLQNKLGSIKFDLPETCISCSIKNFCCGACPLGRLKTKPNEIDCLIKKHAYQFVQNLNKMQV